MNKYIVGLTVFGLMLSGCSSTPVAQTKRQYCYTSQEIQTKDRETVSSQTTLKCTDDPMERVVIKRAGVAKDCFENRTRMVIRGREVIERSIACQKFDGTWEVMPNPGVFN